MRSVQVRSAPKPGLSAITPVDIPLMMVTAAARFHSAGISRQRFAQNLFSNQTQVTATASKADATSCEMDVSRPGRQHARGRSFKLGCSGLRATCGFVNQQLFCVVFFSDFEETQIDASVELVEAFMISGKPFVNLKPQFRDFFERVNLDDVRHEVTIQDHQPHDFASSLHHPDDGMVQGWRLLSAVSGEQYYAGGISRMVLILIFQVLGIWCGGFNSG